jgi:hypothetical protein
LIAVMLLVVGPAKPSHVERPAVVIVMSIHGGLAAHFARLTNKLAGDDRSRDGYSRMTTLWAVGVPGVFRMLCFIGAVTDAIAKPRAARLSLKWLAALLTGLGDGLSRFHKVHQA